MLKNDSQITLTVILWRRRTVGCNRMKSSRWCKWANGGGNGLYSSRQFHNQWAEMVWNQLAHSKDKNRSLMSSGVSERVSKRMSAAERTSEVSNAKQVHEWGMRANERMAQYYMRMRWFHSTVWIFLKIWLKNEKLSIFGFTLNSFFLGYGSLV